MKNIERIAQKFKKLKEEDIELSTKGYSLEINIHLNNGENINSLLRHCYINKSQATFKCFEENNLRIFQLEEIRDIAALAPVRYCFEEFCQQLD